jgi:hypothetical protein
VLWEGEAAMNQTILIRWIETAEARAVRELAMENPNAPTFAILPPSHPTVDKFEEYLLQLARRLAQFPHQRRPAA